MKNTRTRSLGRGTKSMTEFDFGSVNPGDTVIVTTERSRWHLSMLTQSIVKRETVQAISMMTDSNRSGHYKGSPSTLEIDRIFRIGHQIRRRLPDGDMFEMTGIVVEISLHGRQLT